MRSAAKEHAKNEEEGIEGGAGGAGEAEEAKTSCAEVREVGYVDTPRSRGMRIARA